MADRIMIPPPTVCDFFINRDRDILTASAVEKSFVVSKEQDVRLDFLAIKEFGDSKFNADNFHEAILAYTSCLLKLQDLGDSDLALKCYSNRCLCYMHIGNHVSAIDDCSHVLKYRPHDIKALIRRSQSFEAIGELQKAMNDVQVVLQLGSELYGKKVFILATELQRRLKRLEEEKNTSDTSHLLRKASVDESNHIMCLLCLEYTIPGFDSIRLRCRCVLHEHCMITYIRSKLEDKTQVSDQGIPCPFNCGKFVWIDDVDALYNLNKTRPISGLHSAGVAPLKEEEAARFRLWVISSSFRKDDLINCPKCGTPHWLDSAEGCGIRVKCSNSINCGIKFCSNCLIEWKPGQRRSCCELRATQNYSETNALVAASAKCCPNCQMPVTHYHGHACHHIRGCPACGIHFCYRCLCTEAENIRLREERSRCVCEEGRWGTFCSDEDLLKNIVCSPFPHDGRCGCPICPDCRPNKPCGSCPGNCAVCLGMVMPGPTEIRQRERSTATSTACLIRQDSISMHSTSINGYENYQSIVEIISTNSNTCTSNSEGDDSMAYIDNSYLASCYKLQGNAHYQANRFKEAILLFTEAIQLQEDPVYYSNRSACYASLGDWLASASDAQKAILIDKSFLKGYIRLCQAYKQLGRLDDGLNVLKLALSISPNSQQLHNLRKEFPAI